MNSPEQIKAFRRMDYEQYLRTAHWYRQRNRALKLAEHRCHRCDANRQLQVHHLCYDRLGEELDSDLEVVCRGCHLGEHANEAGNGLGIYTKVISDVLRDARFDLYAEFVEAVKVRCANLLLPYHEGQVQRALTLMGGARFERQVPPRSQELVHVGGRHEPLTRAEAAGILASLGAQRMVKSIPEVERITQHEADKRIAAKMVVAEIIESIHRCEQLEQAAAEVSK
jgi:hypothetical protein